MADIRSLARSMARGVYDPSRFQSEYRSEKKRLRDSLTAELAAQNALPGSIAEANDPHRFGSVEGRFDGRFASSGIQAQANDGLIEGIQNPALVPKPKAKLRRKTPFDYEAAEDLLGTDDLFGGLY